ncbi:hypothetical protein HYY71_00035 [Candidatus Woesearchaeota archaeon]|nr:hypothetical protein [Candidatus Woesearchaeota archaeon]
MQLDEVWEESDIADRATANLARLVIKLKGAEDGRVGLSRRLRRKIIRRLKILTLEGRDSIYEYLRGLGEDYMVVNLELGKEYRGAANFLKRFYMEEPLVLVKGRGTGPKDYYRKSHPMRENLRLV